MMVVGEKGQRRETNIYSAFFMFQALHRARFLLHLISPSHKICKADVIIPALKMRDSRFREVRKPVQGHIASK